MNEKRVVCWFSCGAASAVATKLVLAENPDAVIAYCEVKEEHSDNRRFLEDCQLWFGKEILILGNDNYGRSIYEVFRKTRYLKGPSGARCTGELKKSLRRKFQLPGDIQVFGYTVEEEHRANRLIDANNEINTCFPLIERKLTKADTLAMIDRAGIELPAMYRLGYKNANCVGCVKGEAGYWNKIRIDFPDVFEKMARTEELLGRTVCKRESGSRKKGTYKIERIPLRDLPPDLGNYKAEEHVDCGIFCELAEREFVD